MVSVLGNNPELGLPLTHARVTVFAAETEAPTALMGGKVLTVIRTGAGNGAAMDLLSPIDASESATLGSGIQAKTQFEVV